MRAQWDPIINDTLLIIYGVSGSADSTIERLPTHHRAAWKQTGRDNQGLLVEGWWREIVEDEAEKWHQSVVLFRGQYMWKPLPNGMARTSWLSTTTEERMIEVGRSVPLFRSVWLIALLEMGFSKQEPYELLHPEDQRLVERVWKRNAALFPGVRWLLASRADAPPWD